MCHINMEFSGLFQIIWSYNTPGALLILWPKFLQGSALGISIFIKNPRWFLCLATTRHHWYTWAAVSKPMMSDSERERFLCLQSVYSFAQQSCTELWGDRVLSLEGKVSYSAKETMKVSEQNRCIKKCLERLEKTSDSR